MPSRLVTLLGGLAALTLAIMLLAPPHPSALQSTSFPISTDRGPQGLRGLWRWLQGAGIATRSQQQRYDELARAPGLSVTGNLLIINLPQRFPARHDELAALNDWLARGNSALILVAAYDRPDWSAWGSLQSTMALLRSLGYNLSWKPVAPLPTQAPTKFNPVEFVQALEFAPPPLRQLSPIIEHPVLAGVQRVEATAVDNPRSYWDIVALNGERRYLPLLRDAHRYLPVFWTLRAGAAGHLYLSSYADLFGNISLGHADNGRLFANLLGVALAPNGTVINDDMHQGLTDIYDPQAFFADERLHNTLWFLFGFWLLYLLGRSARLAPVPATVAVPRAADFVRAVGGLCARRLSRPDLAQGLLKHFFNQVRGRYGLPTNGQPVWDLLDGHAQLQPRDLRQLQRLASNPRRVSRATLIQLTHLLATLRKRLL